MDNYKRDTAMKTDRNKIIPVEKAALLLNDLSALIESGRSQVAAAVNSAVTITYWQVGKRINEEILHGERAEYGKQVVVSISRQLVERYGKSFENRNLRRMMQFADTKLSLKEECTLSGNFKDPYFLDFIGLKDGYLEDELESALIKELELFILELGKGFAFVQRQKRMIIDGNDFYLDLLFFHRKLKRLVAIDLKIGTFKAGHKGQMELYLNWLDKHERQSGEEAPIGLILCAEAGAEQVELLNLQKDNIMVAEYWTELPPKELLEKKLHSALIEVRERLENRKVIERE